MKDFSKLKLIRFYFEIFRVIIKIQYLYDVDIAGLAESVIFKPTPNPTPSLKPTPTPQA